MNNFIDYVGDGRHENTAAVCRVEWYNWGMRMMLGDDIT